MKLAIALGIGYLVAQPGGTEWDRTGDNQFLFISKAKMIDG